MLILSNDNIQRVIQISEVTDSLEYAYELYDMSKYVMKQRVQLPKDQNTLLLMPCMTYGMMGVKIASVFPDNVDVPVTQGLQILMDGKNGKPKAMINGTTLTNIRTGSLGALAIRHLSSSKVKTIGLVGTGVQGIHQLIAACEERDFNKIFLFNRNKKKTARFICKLKKQINPEINIFAVDDLEEVVQQSDIIITATTSKDPVLPNDPSLYKYKLVIGIGSFQPTMREFPESLFKCTSRLFIDTIDAKNETGDVIDPLKYNWLQDSQVIPFSDVIVKKHSIEKNSEDPILFKSTGMALFDVVVANKVYQRAKELQIGQTVTL